MIIVRNFREAASLFLETVSTFTSTELMSYTSFVGLTVLICVIALERTELQDKVHICARVEPPASQHLPQTLSRADVSSPSFLPRLPFFLAFLSSSPHQVIEGPEIREALHELPLHSRFVDSLYNCHYEDFFKSLAEVSGWWAWYLKSGDELP
jgi:26S proteasome regulatory subunit N7